MEKKIKLKITGMHCASCAMNIDGGLEDTPGVREANTKYAKAETEVIFDDSVVAEQNIFEIIQKLGYQAALIS